MARISCKACGRRYDYEKEGLCPNCGAYNRPPRRETVDINGVVHHLDIAEEVLPPKGKVCYEQQECYEDSARKAHRMKGGRNDKKNRFLTKKAAAISLHDKKKKISITISILTVVFSLLATIISNFAARDRVVTPPSAEPWQDTPQVVELYDGSVMTEEGTFSIVGWDKKEKELTIHYVAEFDPMEKGKVYMEYLNADGEYESVMPETTYHEKNARNEYGTLTFTVSTKEFEPLNLYLEYPNESFGIEIS